MLNIFGHFLVIHISSFACHTLHSPTTYLLPVLPYDVAEVPQLLSIYLSAQTEKSI